MEQANYFTQKLKMWLHNGNNVGLELSRVQSPSIQLVQRGERRAESLFVPEASPLLRVCPAVNRMIQWIQLQFCELKVMGPVCFPAM